MTISHKYKAVGKSQKTVSLLEYSASFSTDFVYLHTLDKSPVDANT